MATMCNRCGVRLYYPNNVIGKESVCTNCFRKEKEKMFEDTEQIKETVNQDIKRDLKADLTRLDQIKKMNSPVKLAKFKEFFGEEWLNQALAEKERADKYEALVRELLEVMMSVAYQECGYEENGITKFDSMAIGARMELLLTLIEHGRLEEINSFGRRVIAKLPGAKEVLENAK